ncbi:hypothetical protein M5D96_006422 [Drosophila gunungcola]|uniref:Uncharacterized protein n=1 Tax=Drosophila gunungcola TaxID=103775 RepID=A0A9P9YNZ0_9MUSC|nr:hypothetical protein M5D96_006422 [Drosophila gunungcola]
MHNLSDAGMSDTEQKDMDSFLNSKLERDSLPEDTPLPYYLAHKEPRSISPASEWDSQTLLKK